MTRGKLTTGRFNTREELLERFWAYYDNGLKVSDASRCCRISEMTGYKIVKDGRPTKEERDGRS